MIDVNLERVMGIEPGPKAVDRKDFLVHAAGNMGRISGPMFAHSRGRRTGSSSTFHVLPAKVISSVDPCEHYSSGSGVIAKEQHDT